MDQNVLEAWLERQNLPHSYLETTRRWFAPLADEIAEQQKRLSRPLIIGINGCQGSGKTTLGEYLKFQLSEDFGLSVICISIDDFYLTRAQRQKLAETVHPLLATRGVPGSHDIPLAMKTLQQLVATDSRQEVAIPRFDKATDDRADISTWGKVASPVDVVIFEGWCMGITPQEEHQLGTAVNELELSEDPDAVWRHYVNRVLAGDYQSLFDHVDYWVMLKAPSFGCVYRWRLEQEKKLAKSRALNDGSKIMDEQQIARFIQHYQRLTEHALEVMPSKVNCLLEMSEDRRIISSTRPNGG